MKMYELTQNFLQVKELLKQDEYTLEELHDTLDAITDDIAVKAKNIGHIIHNAEINANAVDEEIKRLQAIKKRQTDKADFFKSYLKRNMELLNETKIETPTKVFSIKKNPHKLIIEDESIIPATYQIIIPASFKIDNARLKSDLKAGAEIKGAHLEQGTSLQIK